MQKKLHQILDFVVEIIEGRTDEAKIMRVFLRIVGVIFAVWLVLMIALTGIKDIYEMTTDTFSSKQETTSTLLEFDVKQ